MKNFAVVCYDCGVATKFEGTLPRNATCTKCTAYLHCCLNCRFYDAAAYNECHEPQAERVKDKDKANFCDFFEAGKGAGENKAALRKEDSLKKLNDLFGKK